MAGLDTGTLDRRIVVFRSIDIDDGTATVEGPPAEIGRRSAGKTDISDGEQVRAAQNGQEITTHFVVRWDSLTRTITAKDFVACEGLMYEVTGTKEIPGRHVGIEITANAKPDMNP